MNTQINTMPESPLESQAVAPAAIPATRTMYWALRRELWENRWIYLAPLAVAGVFLLGFLVSLLTLPHRMRTALALDPAQQHTLIEQPYLIAEAMIMAAAFFLGLFYCLEALHGERRDRSILFWKSLPVSDFTTVLAKVSIPVILLLLSFVITVATQLIMVLLSTVVLLGSAISAGPLWTHVSLLHRSMGLLYHLLTVHALWYAPIYAWLLLVSAWARRAVFVWAIVPPLAIGFGEKIAFGTSYFAEWALYRFAGPQSFNSTMSNSMPMSSASVDLLGFFSTPGLWIGLAVAAGFLAAATRLRRYRGPI